MIRKHWQSLVVVSACAIIAGLNSRPAIGQINVNAATPNNAAQGTTALNVTVSGSGFEQGAAATWFVSGTTNSGGVSVNSTTFVNSSTLVANITVANTATTGAYDIAVKNSNGRTGVGSDAFTINSMAVTSNVSSTDATGASYTVQGDSSGISTYDNEPSSCALFDPHNICIIKSLLPNDWYLNLSTVSGRSLKVTFHPLNGSADESALDGNYLGSALTTRCFDSNNNRLDIQFLLPGASFTRCSLRVNFSTPDGTGYAYALGPAFSGTGWSTVTCTSGSAQSCSAWTITPTPGSMLPNPTLASVAILQEFTKHSSPIIGTYVMTFNIVLTRP
jgi:hypothetical protein